MLCRTSKDPNFTMKLDRYYLALVLHTTTHFDLELPQTSERDKTPHTCEVVWQASIPQVVQTCIPQDLTTSLHW